jgi:hypothetical protein
MRPKQRVAYAEGEGGIPTYVVCLIESNEPPATTSRPFSFGKHAPLAARCEWPREGIHAAELAFEEPTRWVVPEPDALATQGEQAVGSEQPQVVRRRERGRESMEQKNGGRQGR